MRTWVDISTSLILILLIAIFISPIAGIHIHHEVDASGNLTIIHSYLFEEHDANHPPVDTPPESLPEHLTSTGMAEDLGGWDTLLYTLVTLGFLALLVYWLPVYKRYSFLFSEPLPMGKSPTKIRITLLFNRLHMFDAQRYSHYLNSKGTIRLNFLPPPSYLY